MTAAAITGLIAATVPIVGILIVWLRNKTAFAAMNQRFDDMRELWRSEPHRVERAVDSRRH